METLLPHIGPETTVVSLQNGLNEELIASLIGAHRTVGCLVNWGGDYIEPGHILYGGDGPMRIGELDGSTTERIVELQKVLDNVAETTITPNIFGHLWSKVIWGCFYIGNALGTSTTVDMLRAEKKPPRPACPVQGRRGGGRGRRRDPGNAVGAPLQPAGAGALPTPRWPCPTST